MVSLEIQQTCEAGAGKPWIRAANDYSVPAAMRCSKAEDHQHRDECEQARRKCDKQRQFHICLVRVELPAFLSVRR